jgi:hypothetical protein
MRSSSSYQFSSLLMHSKKYLDFLELILRHFFCVCVMEAQ